MATAVSCIYSATENRERLKFGEYSQTLSPGVNSILHSRFWEGTSQFRVVGYRVQRGGGQTPQKVGQTPRIFECLSDNESILTFISSSRTNIANNNDHGARQRSPGGEATPKTCLSKTISPQFSEGLTATRPRMRSGDNTLTSLARLRAAHRRCRCISKTSPPTTRNVRS